MSSSSPASSSPQPASALAAGSAPAWVSTAPPAFLRSGGPFVGPIPAPKDNSSVNVLITGAARGIGLELAQQYAAANSASIVFAAVRDPKAQTIVSLAAKYNNIVIVQLDVTSDASINASFAQVSKVVDHLDILINNAGVLGNLDLPTATSREHLLSVINTNAAGPMVVTQKYLPLLKSAKKLPSRVINVSSGLGCNAWVPTAVSAVGSKLSNAYGVSKAVMNYLTNIFAASVPEVIFVSVHPGWVETDMAAEVSPGAPVKPKDCVQALRALIESRELKHSGLFFDNIDNGAQLPF